MYLKKARTVTNPNIIERQNIIFRLIELPEIVLRIHQKTAHRAKFTEHEESFSIKRSGKLVLFLNFKIDHALNVTDVQSCAFNLTL